MQRNEIIVMPRRRFVFGCREGELDCARCAVLLADSRQGRNLLLFNASGHLHCDRCLTTLSDVP
jgi:hypothetical protein